jgi:hypothetical protein
MCGLSPSGSGLVFDREVFSFIEENMPKKKYDIPIETGSVIQ